jgi:hypothetical protein
MVKGGSIMAASRNSQYGLILHAKFYLYTMIERKIASDFIGAEH